jgi:hypothetical protein
MKKAVFIIMMLFAVGFAFSQQNKTARDVANEEGIRTPRTDLGVGQSVVNSPGAMPSEDDDIKARLQQNQDYFQDFQEKFKTLKTFNNTKQQRDQFKAMQTMVDRQKRLVDYKLEEIQIMERANKTVPISDWTHLKDLINRYHVMVVDLDNWVNKRSK